MKRTEFVSEAVGKLFKPADPAKAARGQVVRTIGTGVITLAAWRTGGLLSAALWVWLGYRLLALGIIVFLGSELTAERERRLASLPSGWRDFLITGKKPREYAAYPGSDQ